MRIPKGNTLSYEAVAQKTGFPRAARAVGTILSRNSDPHVPCHRVITEDGFVGAYFGSHKRSWEKLAILLKESAIAIVPTDTIYGIVGSALQRKTVEKIYTLRKRNPKKPMVILIHSLSDLALFGIHTTPTQRKVLKTVWPGKVSVILRCRVRQFTYLHRGTRTLALRMPHDKILCKILSISGPLVAPSANLEGHAPAKNMREARKYFGSNVLYCKDNAKKGTPSTILELTGTKIRIVRI